MISANKGRGRLLITVGTAMAASLVASGAQAAEAEIDPTGTVVTVEGHATVQSVLSNVADILASIEDADGAITETESPTGTTSLQVSDNEILATAIANDGTNIAPLGAIQNNPPNDGLASLVYLVNGQPGNSGPVTSEITDSSIVIDLQNFEDGSASTIDNTIAAHSAGNVSETTVSGAIPNTYTSTLPGSSTLDFASGLGGSLLLASGSVVASTVQLNNDPAVTSTVDTDAITLDLISTVANTITASPELDRNEISAAAEGNSATTLIDVASGGAPTFVGSAVLTNAQLNNATVADGEIVAESIDSLIFATVDATAGVNVLEGGLSVDDNEISSSASGNQALGTAPGEAGNSIVFADGISVQPNSGVTAASTETEYTGLGMTSEIIADIVIDNSQVNIGPGNGTRLSIEAITDGSIIGADVQAINDGSVSVSGNETSSTARGNTASSAFATGDASAIFDATLAVANQQTNTYANVSATTTGTDIGADVVFAGNAQDLDDSSVLVNGNTSSAAAYGNQVSQSANVEATSFAGMPQPNARLRGGTGGVPGDGHIDTNGNVTVSSLQSIYSSNVTASEDGDVYLDVHGDSVISAGLEATGNTQEAIALGNTGSNTLSATSTTNVAGMGVASVQIVADDTTISATTASQARITSEFDVESSSLELTDNLQRSIAYGGSASNTLDLETEEMNSDTTGISSTVVYDAGAVDGFVLDNTTTPVVDSANGLLNIQSVGATILAESNAPQAFLVDVAGDVIDGGSLVNSGNALVSAAYGTDARNTATLDVGNVISDDSNYEDILALANVQTVAADSTISAEASGGTVVETTVDGVLSNSDISTSSNIVQALAYGNLAESTVGVTATNIEANAVGAFGVVDIDPVAISGVSATVSANNVQSAAGTIAATLIDGAGPTATEIRTTVGDDVTTSSIDSDENTLSAGVTANRGDTSVSIAGNSIGASGALANYQDMQANLSATIGIGDAPNEGGVFVELGGSLSASSVSVSDNNTAGSVTGNSASNALSVAGNDVTAGPNQTLGAVDTNATGLTDIDAAYGLGNVQVVTGAPTLTSSVFGTFAIDMTDVETIGSSSLAVDDNSQSARAVANTGDNSVSLTGTNVSASSILSSNQVGDVSTLTATSNLDIFAPAVSTGSSISMSGNENSAVAVINDVTNEVLVAATNLDPRDVANDAGLDSDWGVLVPVAISTADHLLHNQQTADGEATATAETNLFNDDNTQNPSPGLANGSVAIDGNLTFAEASANRAINTASVSGSSSLGASAGLSNLQQSSVEVTANATTNATLTLAGDGATDLPAVDGSGISLDGNTTSALARGNSATNVLNYTANSTYGPATAAAVAGSSVGPAGAASDARVALLNNQFNGGPVAANSVGATYQVVLNSAADPELGIAGSSIGVMNNTIGATAYGNIASNTLTLTALNTEVATSTLGSYQVNAANVSATVTTVAYGIESGLGTVVGSSLGVSGNTVAATAVGNSVVSTITTGN